jgi:haloalkane dehalogenase
MSDNEDISVEFPYESKYVEIEGSKLHYVEQGEGAPVLFLHGNPTSSYLWRNVIPHVSGDNRCIALDLIGMGRSDKPDIEYRFFDHVRYVEGFIEELGLKDITLVVHDWGSALGFHYARRNESNVRGVAFMEAILMSVPSWDAFPPDARKIFEAFRTPDVGWDLIAKDNAFVERVLPGSIHRELSEAEMDAYRAPYPDEQSRKPLWRWPNEIPIEDEPKDVADAVGAYNAWMIETELPMILFHGAPGALIPPPVVGWVEDNIANVETVDIGDSIHFVQEDNPHGIGRGIADWLERI